MKELVSQTQWPRGMLYKCQSWDCLPQLWFHTIVVLRFPKASLFQSCLCCIALSWGMGAPLAFRSCTALTPISPLPGLPGQAGTFRLASPFWRCDYQFWFRQSRPLERPRGVALFWRKTPDLVRHTQKIIRNMSPVHWPLALAYMVAHSSRRGCHQHPGVGRIPSNRLWRSLWKWGDLKAVSFPIAHELFAWWPLGVSVLISCPPQVVAIGQTKPCQPHRVPLQWVHGCTWSAGFSQGPSDTFSERLAIWGAT